MQHSLNQMDVDWVEGMPIHATTNLPSVTINAASYNDRTSDGNTQWLHPTFPPSSFPFTTSNPLTSTIQQQQQQRQQQPLCFISPCLLPQQLQVQQQQQPSYESNGSSAGNHSFHTSKPKNKPTNRKR